MTNFGLSNELWTITVIALLLVVVFVIIILVFIINMPIILFPHNVPRWVCCIDLARCSNRNISQLRRINISLAEVDIGWQQYKQRSRTDVMLTVSRGEMGLYGTSCAPSRNTWRLWYWFTTGARPTVTYQFRAFLNTINGWVLLHLPSAIVEFWRLRLQ